MKKKYRSATAFVEKLLEDPEIRVHYETERAKTLIAEMVRSARVRAGLTQVQLAKLAKTTQAVVSRIESGTDSRIPSLELLSKLAGACRAKLSFSFSFDKKKAA